MSLLLDALRKHFPPLGGQHERLVRAEDVPDGLDHQVLVVTRRTRFRLERAESRLHVVEAQLLLLGGRAPEHPVAVEQHCEYGLAQCLVQGNIDALREVARPGRRRSFRRRCAHSALAEAFGIMARL